MFAGTEAWTAQHESQSMLELEVGIACVHAFWRGEVDDVSIRLEHVDLLDRLDGLDVHLLQGRLELLVVRAGGLMDLLDFPPWCTLAPVSMLLAVFVHICYHLSFHNGDRFGKALGVRIRLP